MNIITILVIIVTLFMCVGIWLFLAFTRQGKNLIAQILFNKRYVICHLKHTSTDFIDTYRIVPAGDFLTKVSNGIYNLNPAYSLFSWKGRLHFKLNEGDCIPEYLTRTNGNEEIVIQVKEVQTALENKAYQLIFGKKNEIALLLAGLGLVISVCVAIYAIYTIGNITPMIEYLANHPPDSNTGNTIQIVGS